MTTFAFRNTTTQLFSLPYFSLPKPNPQRSQKLRRRTNSPPITMTITADQDYDRAKEVKQFDDSKVGVKGLTDSGISSIPKFFRHPPDPIPVADVTKAPVDIPVVDLSGDRNTAVDQIREAAAKFGFFQVVNHTIPLTVLHNTLSSMKAFHELPNDEKSQFYKREIGTGVAYSSNFDLYQSKAASWRDTIQIRLSPVPPEPEALPEICRKEVMEWNREIQRLGEIVMGMLSEGLGVAESRLKDMSCAQGKVMVGHYYPYCPEPDLTVGLTSHTDPGVLAVVLENMEGLQIKYGGEWVQVKTVPGALIINIGDVLQIISNSEYKSVEHRVVAQSIREPRVSIGVFFNPGDREYLFGPLPEITSPEKPPLFRNFTITEYMKVFFNKHLDGSLIDYFKLS